MVNLKIAVIIPLLNEAEVLPHLYKRLNTVLIQSVEDYEIIFINDGSCDSSLDLLKQFNRENPRVKIVSLSRNFGHQIAVSAGLKFSSGDAVVVMDADLQDPPDMIPKFIEKWKEGYKVVYGVRKRRKENLFKKLCYRLFYRFLKIISKSDIPLDAGDFCLMDRKVVDLLNSLPERVRFVRGLRGWVGFPQIGIEYERDKRYSGKTKYTFPKLVGLALDGLISFSEFPLKIAITMGFIISLLSIVYAVYLIFNRIFRAYHIPGWTSIVVAVMFLGGVQLIMFGILGGYITKIFDEVKGRPLYVIDEIIGLEDKKTILKQ